MRDRYGDSHKYDSPMAEFIDTHDAYDETSGDVQYFLWFGRAGKWIITHDDRGSVDSVKYDTVAEAQAEFVKLDDRYSEAMSWSEEVSVSDYQRHYLNGYFKYVESPLWEDDKTYSHPEFRGIGLRIYGPGIVAEGFGEETLDYETLDGIAIVHMVGDDTLYRVEVSDLTVIPEVCGCGQIGCGWDS